jgi:hypothetical protein
MLVARMSIVRWCSFLSLIGALTAQVLAENEFPYSAFIAVEGAEVVSGPGHRYYATDRLARGTQIEVYAEEASGWLAIRPPEGSFSWVPGERIERLAEDEAIGRVTEPTPAWVGTAAEKVKEHRELVTLKADEMVRILGEKQVAVGDEPQVWLKIAPPAGEFRWVHLRDVSRQEPEEINEVVGIESAIDSPLDADEQSAEERALDAQAEGDTAEEEEPRRFRPATSSIALRDIATAKLASAKVRRREPIELAQFRETEAVPKLSPDGFVPRKRKGSELQSSGSAAGTLASRNGPPAFSRPRTETPTLLADSRPVAAQPVSTSSAAAGSAIARNAVANELQQLELELSLMVAQDRSTWDLGGLAQRVNELVEGGGDPVARGQARLLADKIQQFEESFDVAAFGPIRNPSRPTVADDLAADAQAGSAEPRYDGQGWLQPVQSLSGKKSPPYALVDSEGKPVMFVTPPPGMNLSRYLNKEVGVYGQRGYIEALKAAHVTVERVIDLGRVVR